jgi:subtilisin family serine protease
MRVAVTTKFATAVVQSGDQTDQTLVPMWNRGLHGEGQFIGCGDTGIDMSHNFFYDPGTATPLGSTNNNHRKVVRYQISTGADDGDLFQGHGTHVAGTIAGEALCPDASNQASISQHNGVAYKAKLVFVDLGSNAGSLTIPGDLTTSYFNIFQNAGARISSHSWACAPPQGQTPITGCNKYSTMSRDADQFAHDNPDHLIVYAAGNTGDSGYYTVQAPSTAKNVLTVGASVNSKASWDELCQWEPTNGLCTRMRSSPGEGIGSFSARGYTLPDTRIKPEIVAPGQYIISARSNGGQSEPTRQCDPVVCEDTDSFKCPNTTGLMKMMGTSMATPVASAAISLMRQYLTEGFYPTGSKLAANQMSSIPAALLKAMAIHSAVGVTGDVDISQNGNINTLNLETIPVPNRFEGFGRIQLDQVLSFSYLGANQNRLVLIPSASVTNKGTQKYCFSVRDANRNATSFYTHELKATLVWTDPVGSLISGYALVNDLDLVISDEYNKIYYSNGDSEVSSLLLSQPGRDSNYFIF